MTHWQERCQLFAAENKIITKQPIIFLGDSLIENFDLARFFPGQNIINRGINGDHIDGLCERFAVSITAARPQQVYVMIGINDLGRGDSTARIKDHYRQLLALLKTLPASRIHLQSILPASAQRRNLSPRHIAEVNAFIGDQARQNDFHWHDLFPLFSDKDHFIKSELTTDGLHLSENGYRLWAGYLQQGPLEK